MTFVVLFVCTGNICRSPMAERMFAAHVAGVPGIDVMSAGTSGLTGWPMDAASALALRELGGEADGHAARRLDAGSIARADLVLTAERAHRDAVTLADRAAAARTFTLREFARLGAQATPLVVASPDALRARVAELDRRRATAPRVRRGADDIGDPYGAPLSQVRACAVQIAEAVEGVVAALGLAPSGEGRSALTTRKPPRTR